jgi:hypothetical protein
MTVRRIFVLTSIVSLVITGCLFDHTVEEIAKMRKSGDLDAAKARTLEVLKEKPDRMDVWRELALCDIAQCSKNSKKTEAILSDLVEAGLICAAVAEHEKGKPDRDWLAASNMTSSQLTNSIGYLMSIPETRKSVNYRRDHSQSLILPDDLPDAMRESLEEQFEEQAGLEELKLEARTFLDPDETLDIVRRLVIVSELLRRLPCDNPSSIAITLSQVDRKIQSTTWDSNLSADLVNRSREAALKGLNEAQQQAASELSEQGHFDPATILENKILE